MDTNQPKSPLDEIKSVSDFIRFVYPPPEHPGEPPADNPNDPEYRAKLYNYNIYQRWGYDQYLICTQQKSLEQLEILMRSDYNRFQLSRFLNGTPLEEKLKGLPIVRAKRRLTFFLCSSVAEGWCGVALFRDDDGWFCMFPTRSIFGPFLNTVAAADIEFTGETYVGAQELFDHCDKTRIGDAHELRDHFAAVPELGNFFVFSARESYPVCTIEAVPAEYDEKRKKWKKVKGVKKAFYNIDKEKFFETRLLDI